MNGWKIKPIFQRDPIYADYAERMAKEMRATIPPLPKKIGQEASTQRILDRPESEDAAWRNRPLPTWEQAGATPWAGDPYEMSDGERDRMVGKRDLSPDDIILVEKLRRSRGNTLGDAVSEGATSVTEESKERAVHAFMYSQPAQLSETDRQKIIGLTKVTSKSPEPEQPPLMRQSWWDKFWRRRIASKDVVRGSLWLEGGTGGERDND